MPKLRLKLTLRYQSLKVLDLVGLAEAVVSESTPIEAFHDATADGETLGTSDVPSTFAKKYRQPAAGVRRTFLNLKLKQMLIDLEVDVREGWELIDIQEDDDSITAVFDGGRTVKGSMLIGCDGINSAVRAAMLRMQGITEGKPTYTGLTQAGGLFLSLVNGLAY